MTEGSINIPHKGARRKTWIEKENCFQAPEVSDILRLLMKNAGFLCCYLVFVTSANILLKLSADAHETWFFVTMLAAGNLAGFVGVLAYTGLLRTLPLHVAFPLTRGLVVIGVQLVAALIVFRESFRLSEAAGVVLVTAGIILVGVSAPRHREQAKNDAGQGESAA